MLGLLLKRRGAFRAAARELVAAANLAPNDFSAHYEAGTALMRCRQFDAAVLHLRQACDLNPVSVEAHTDLATAMRSVGRPADAVPLYQEAIRLGPGNAFSHNNLGAVLCDLGKFDEAYTSVERALELKPDLADAHYNRGNALKELGLVSEAVVAYRKALEISPDHRGAHSNLLFAMMFDPASDARTILQWGQLFQSRHLTLSRNKILAPASRRGAGRRLRVGYVCADFRDSVFMRFLPQLIRNHDRNEFEVFCYSNVPVPDAMTQVYVEHADHFKTIVELDDDAAAKLIFKDRIDILLDTTMHLANGRLGVFARRPAPLQVTWLAYPGTTGVDCIDFRLGDPHLDPPGTDELYSERTVRLPETFWCYDPSIELPVSELPAKERGFLTFGSLNNFCKTNEVTFALWARVLRAFPTSHLLLVAPPGSARKRTCAFFEREGVDSGRIEFVDVQPRVDYLKTYWRIDIALDTLPYNGQTTSLDALWMGVPVLTLVGDTVAGRAGLSQAKNLEMDELCAASPDEFCARAVALGSDLDRLTSLRTTLRARLERSPLMNAPRFTKHFEQTLLELHRGHALER